MNLKSNFLLLLVVSLLIPFLTLGGCDSDNNGDDEGGSSTEDGGTNVALSCPETNLDISVCDPLNGPFSLTIDNSFLPTCSG